MLSTASKTSKTPKTRLNLRVWVFALIILAPIGWMVYTFTSLVVSHGIEQVGDYQSVNLKALGNFPFDDMRPDLEQVPSHFRALDGKKVLLVGEMYSDFNAGNGVEQFQLVYSIANCCFGGPPKVQERVFANAPKGERVPIFGGLTSVYGTLHVRPIVENGKVVSLFDLDVEKIEPAS